MQSLQMIQEGRSRLRKVNERGYRDLVLAMKEMSLMRVGNAKTNDLPSGDLQLAWKKSEKRWDPKPREDRVGYIMDDETYLTYVLASLPQEEDQTMMFVHKDKLRRGKLMIEEAKKELKGWNEEWEEHALVVQNPNLRKPSTKNVVIVASMPIKQLIVMKEN